MEKIYLNNLKVLSPTGPMDDLTKAKLTFGLRGLSLTAHLKYRPSNRFFARTRCRYALTGMTASKSKSKAFRILQAFAPVDMQGIAVALNAAFAEHLYDNGPWTDIESQNTKFHWKRSMNRQAFIENPQFTKFYLVALQKGMRQGIICGVSKSTNKSFFPVSVQGVLHSLSLHGQADSPVDLPRVLDKMISRALEEERAYPSVNF
jgi:hypothetical protein